MALLYPTAGSSMLPTWGTSKQPVNVAPSTFQPTPQQQYATPISPQPMATPQQQYKTPAGPTNKPASTPVAPTTPAPTNPEPPPPPSGPSDAELNSAFDPLFNYLSQAESQLRSDLPTYQKEINQQAETSKKLLDTGRQSTITTLQTQQDQGQRRKEDVISAARRLFSELQMANNQRFGSSTSAGMAASELQGREFQRSSAQASQGYNDLVRELDNKRIEVDNNYQVSLQQLEDQRQARINDVGRQFQEKLLEINRQRTEVESQKANRRLAALDQYRQQVFAIQLQNYQFQQQLAAAKQQAQLELEMNSRQLSSIGQGGAALLSNYGANTSTDPTTQFGVADTQTNTQANPYVGTINSSNPDDYLRNIMLAGRVAGSSATDPRFADYQPY